MSGKHQLTPASIINPPTSLSRRRLLGAAIGVGIAAVPDARRSIARRGDWRLRPSASVIVLSMNVDRHPETLPDTRVRQAVAHVIDLAGAAFVAQGESGVPIRHMITVGDGQVPLLTSANANIWLHPCAVNHVGASALLAEAGWSKEGGAWTMPNGEDAQFDLRFPAECADAQAAAQFISQNLTAFGLRCDARAVALARNHFTENDGGFTLAMGECV